MSALTWTCATHGVVTSGDCPGCDDELIALAEEAAGPRCRDCGRRLLVGEDVWAEDWTVLDVSGTEARWRNEVRYQCEGCHG